ncbi:thermonuclease family protein [Sinorhodobacter sp. B57]|nr:thermonuclease family protein [Sedimentimonas flavescens]
MIAIHPVLARDRVTGTGYVRDGDTIVVAGVPIRLNGVDAPELSARYGRESKAFMQRAIRGREITCDLNGDRTYDRWVGVCFVKVDREYIDLGAALVANGYALDCARYSGGRYRSLEPAGARQRLGQASCC